MPLPRVPTAQRALSDESSAERESKEPVPEQLVPSATLCELLQVEHTGKPIAVSQI